MSEEKNCLFAKSHEWAYLDGDIATVGISDYAQKEISDIVFVELPAIGDAVTQGKACAVIESVKAAADFMAPMSGEVLEINDAVVDDPSLVNQSSHADGWFFKIKVTDLSERDALMEYDAYISSAEH